MATRAISSNLMKYDYSATQIPVFGFGAMHGLLENSFPMWSDVNVFGIDDVMEAYQSSLRTGLSCNLMALSECRRESYKELIIFVRRLLCMWVLR